MDKTEIIELLKNKVAEAMDTTPDMVDEDESFMRLGIDSVEAISIVNTISDELEMEVSPVAIFEYKTITDFAEYLANGGENADD